jgi:hypothetical protein
MSPGVYDTRAHENAALVWLVPSVTNESKCQPAAVDLVNCKRKDDDDNLLPGGSFSQFKLWQDEDFIV